MRVAAIFEVVAAVGGAPTASTSFGSLIGDSRKASFGTCDFWKGVPFAQPPLGSLRFAAPQPWKDQFPKSGRKATEFGNVCVQDLGKVVGSEDCLFLNVWRPQSFDPALPVMIWFHGGAFVFGSGSDPFPLLPAAVSDTYDGCRLAAVHDMVVVTVNYRLGPLGFAAFGSVDGGMEANFGMQDQREAMRWVQQEIHAFGGDPTKVTIFGESAGAISVMYHMVSPASAGLFRAGISESGIPTATGGSYGVDVTKQFGAKVGCADETTLKQCLAKQDATDLIKNAGEAGNPFTAPGWNPVVDGVDMPEYPLHLFRTGKTNSAALLAGTNTNEGNLFVWPYYATGLNATGYEAFVHELLTSKDPVQRLNSSELATVMQQYPSKSGLLADNRAAAAEMITDATFLCGTQVGLAHHASHAPAFLYRFNHRSACISGLLKLVVPGVFHGTELTYVWNTPTSQACIFTAEEERLASTMQLMWANFAKNLDPSTTGRDGILYPAYNSSTKEGLILQTGGIVHEQSYRDSICQFWDQLLFTKFDPKMKEILV